MIPSRPYDKGGKASIAQSINKQEVPSTIEKSELKDQWFWDIRPEENQKNYGGVQIIWILIKKKQMNFMLNVFTALCVKTTIIKLTWILL